jgi:hypothetical protein
MNIFRENWMADRVNDLEYALKVAKDALKFYSEEQQYMKIDFETPITVLLDNGLRARTALERIEERVGENNEETN